MLADRLEPLSVMGLPLHWHPDYPAWLLRQRQQQNGVHVITLNAEMAMQAEDNPRLRQTIQAAELVIPDGAGVVLYFRTQGQRIQRCPGIELAASLLDQLQSETVFFYGGAPDIAAEAAHYWQQRRPRLTLYSQHGYLNDDEQQALQQQLQALQPGVILVGLGVPRQEFWITDHRHLCPEAIWIGVGGSFDIWAGRKARAPQWFCNHNLEWLYRLYQEPWRWRRMLALPQFAWRALTYRKPRPQLSR